jgi:hypothetical protein
MDNQRNVLMVDFANNPDLKALVQGWEVGKEYELNLTVQLNEMNDDGAKFQIKEIASEEPGAGEEEEPITPEANTPVMMVMGEGNKEPYVAP